MHVIGEDRSQRLDVIPAQYQVIVTRRPKYACRTCQGAVVQAPAPARLIEGGLPTERLVAHVVVAKYADHCPLYRQAQILARQGITIDRSMLAFWTGYAAAEIKPVWRLMREELLRSTKLFVDETTAPVLDPGRGRTKTGYFWALARDDRPWQGGSPPAVVYSYAPGRRGDYAVALLKGYTGVLQTDGYAGYRALADPKRAGGPATLAFCWAHWRRQFFDLAKSPPAPIAAEALKRIAELYEIEAEIRGKSAEERRAARQEKTKPLVDALKAWLEKTLARVAGGSSIALAIRYGLNHWDGLVRFLDDGRIEIDSNTVERSMRPIATKHPLCPSSSTLWKHWKLVSRRDATRAICSRNRGNHPFVLQVGGSDLVRSSWNDLLGGQDTVLDQPPDAVMADAERRFGLRHRQPLAVLLGGTVGMDTVHPAHRTDTVRGPGFALTGRHSHPVQSCCDVRIRPASRHALHHRERLLGRATAMLARARLADAQLRVLTAAPMDRQDDLARRIVDIGDDVGDQRPHEPLARAHRDPRRIPGGIEIFRQARKVGRHDGEGQETAPPPAAPRSPGHGAVPPPSSSQAARQSDDCRDRRRHNAVRRAWLHIALAAAPVRRRAVVRLAFPCTFARPAGCLDRHRFHGSQ